MLNAVTANFLGDNLQCWMQVQTGKCPLCVRKNIIIFFRENACNFFINCLFTFFVLFTGKGPWSSEVSGIVKIGQTMTMVLGIKDEDNKFDMVVSSIIWIGLYAQCSKFLLKVSKIWGIFLK